MLKIKKCILWYKTPRLIENITTINLEIFAIVQKKHNTKYVSYKKARLKLFKTQREKKIIFMEFLHEQVRKSIDKKLPSRLSSIILYDNLEDCYNLAKKWKNNANIVPLGLFKVKCEGKLHACATTPDKKKPASLSKKDHLKGLIRYWKGDKEAETQEYLFQGKAEIIEILNPTP